MFNHYYDTALDKAMSISDLIAQFEKNGTEGVSAASSVELKFSAEEWNSKEETEKLSVLMNYRIAYKADAMVNWCPAFGTDMANDEVSEGLSVRGGHPVEQKVMSQWCLRVSAYAGRLLEGLERIDWTDSLKEALRNWIGGSEGRNSYTVRHAHM